jgi:hypothetical protein
MGSSAIVSPGVLDPATLEALACREALALMVDLSYRRFLVASDCKQVIADIVNGTGGKYAAIVREISMSRSTFDDVIFKFKGRRSNSEAHSLARLALSLDQGRHLWLLESHNIVSIPVTLDVE